MYPDRCSPVFTLFTPPAEWPNVMDLSCALLCCSLAKACGWDRGSFTLCINSGMKGLLDYFKNVDLGTYEDSIGEQESRILYLVVPGK